MKYDTTAIRRACSLANTQAAFARRLQVTPPTVHQWMTGDRPVPWDKCVLIETHFGVPVEELRPDLSTVWKLVRQLNPARVVS